MLRRVLSTILIFPLLCTQLPAMPHSHAGTGTTEPEDHAARPHVHLHGHVHHHHGDGHSHHHYAPVPQPKSENTSNDPATAPHKNGGDHDDDAVYVPDCATYGSTSKSVTWKPTNQIVETLDWDVALAESTDSQAEVLSSLPPPGSTWRAPLYLRTLSLRI